MCETGVIALRNLGQNHTILPEFPESQRLHCHYFLRALETCCDFSHDCRAKKAQRLQQKNAAPNMPGSVPKFVIWASVVYFLRGGRPIQNE